MKHPVLIFLFTILSLAYCSAQTLEKAYTYYLQGNYDQALGIYTTFSAQDPNNIDLLCNIGFILKKQNKITQALEVYLKAQALSAEKNSKIERALSHIYLTLGDFQHGWPAYEYRWKQPPDYNKQLKAMVDSGHSLHNKKILLTTEYGFGDTLHFIRYAQVLKNQGAYVIVECHKPELIPLLTLCPYIDEIIPSNSNVPAHDAHALIMSMPYIMGTTQSTIPNSIPYIKADPTLVTQWRQRLTRSTFNIGICWQTDMHTNSNDISVKQDAQQKSIALEYLAPLSVIPGIHLYSLQKNNDDVKKLQQHYHIQTFENIDTQGAFMDTAALIQNMDLIITIDTAIAHLAGAMGKPTLLLLPFAADWRWMNDTRHSQWYPTMKLFRQQRAGDWDSVIDSVSQELVSLLFSKNIISNQIIDTYAMKLIEHDHLEDAAFLYKIISTFQRDVNALYKYAYLLSRINKPQESIDIYTKVIKCVPENSIVKLGLAKAYLAAGDLEQGWPLFEERLVDTISLHKAFGYYQLTPNDCKDKTFLLRAEWGLGDMVHFVRYADLLKKAGAKTILVQTFEPLIPLFSRCPLIDKVVSINSSIPSVDYHIPLLSLPFIFKTTLQTIPAPIPYLFADPMLVDHWKDKIKHDTGFKIGICWHAKPIYIEDHKHTRRSIPLSTFELLTSIEGVTFYTLQKEYGLEEMEHLKTLSFQNCGSELDTDHGKFMDTAALMINLDLIITADTSIAHIAGALGKKVWVLLPFCPEWRWFAGHPDYAHAQSTPWYPTTMRLFKQCAPGNWDTVMQEVCKALKEEIKK